MSAWGCKMLDVFAEASLPNPCHTGLLSKHESKVGDSDWCQSESNMEKTPWEISRGWWEGSLGWTFSFAAVAWSYEKPPSLNLWVCLNLWVYCGNSAIHLSSWVKLLSSADFRKINGDVTICLGWCDGPGYHLQCWVGTLSADKELSALNTIARFIACHLMRW